MIGVRAVVGIVVGVVALLFATVYGLGGFQRLTADFRGETDQVEQTQADGTFRIAAYERFFDMCAAVQADEARIRALQDELESESITSERRAQVEASITGVRGSRASKIAQYNADAAKDFTVGQFRDSGLPYQIDETAEETTCVVQ